MTIIFLKKIQSDWKYQTTIHFVNRKQNTNYKGFVSILETDKDHLNQIYRSQVQYNNSLNLINIIHDLENSKIKKIYENRKINYQIDNIQAEKLTILYKNNNIIFKEIINIININFFLVIGVFKKDNKYKYISVTSYIKVL